MLLLKPTVRFMFLCLCDLFILVVDMISEGSWLCWIMIVYILMLIFIVFFYSYDYKNVEKVTIEARLPIEAAAVYEFEVKIDGQRKIKVS